MTDTMEVPTASETGYLNPSMNRLLEAMRLPAVSKVPPSWQPPMPSFMRQNGHNPALEAEEVEVEASAEATTDEPRTAPSGESVENVHTPYGTAKQWTKNVDHVMSGLCKWLNGDTDRAPYRADDEDFTFMQESIGAYLRTLNVNLNPKAAMYAAVIVVYIGHIATGVMYRGRQLFAWAQKWWAERKREKQAEAARAANERRLSAIMAALEHDGLTAEDADFLRAEAERTASDLQEAEVIEEEAEDGNPYIDPDFRPRPTSPEAITREELKYRKHNGFCLLPSCDRPLGPRNKAFCCKEHRNEYNEMQHSNPELPAMNDLPTLDII